MDSDVPPPHTALLGFPEAAFPLRFLYRDLLSLGIPESWSGDTAGMSISECQYPRPDCQEERAQGLCHLKSNFHPRRDGGSGGLGPLVLLPTLPGPELGPSILSPLCHKGPTGC